jgi:protein FAM32A
MSDAYDFRPGGSLKLKGVKEGGVKKKKKSKSSSSKSSKDQERLKELLQEEMGGSPSGSGRNSPAATSASGAKDNRTEAEKRFEETKRRRLAERVEKLAHKTHKERVQEFNAHLETLSEHHDIPKVGPG